MVRKAKEISDSIPVNNEHSITVNVHLINLPLKKRFNDYFKLRQFHWGWQVDRNVNLNVLTKGY